MQRSLAVPLCLRRRPVPDHSCHFRASGARQNCRSPRCGIDCGELCSAYIGRSSGRTICLPRKAHDYYRTPRAMCPTAENKLLVRSFPEVLSYDALRFADKFLTQPLLLIVGEQSDTAYQAESILERAASARKNWYALKAQPTFLYMIKMQTKQ